MIEDSPPTALTVCLDELCVSCISASKNPQQSALSRPYTFIVLALLILIASSVLILRTPTDISRASTSRSARSRRR